MELPAFIMDPIGDIFGSFEGIAFGEDGQLPESQLMSQAQAAAEQASLPVEELLSDALSTVLLAGDASSPLSSPAVGDSAIAGAGAGGRRCATNVCRRIFPCTCFNGDIGASTMRTMRSTASTARRHDEPAEESSTRTRGWMMSALQGTLR